MNDRHKLHALRAVAGTNAVPAVAENLEAIAGQVERVTLQPARPAPSWTDPSRSARKRRQDRRLTRRVGLAAVVAIASLGVLMGVV